MAAGEYLKSASASLYRAATALQQQAKDMQAGLMRTRSDKSAIINKNTVEMKTKQVEADAISDEKEKSRLSQEIQRLQQEIMAAEQELKQAEAAVQSAVQAKLGSSQGLQNQARALGTQAGNIDT